MSSYVTRVFIKYIAGKNKTYVSVEKMEMKYDYIYGLPKVELHAHLHGSIRPATLEQLVLDGGFSNEIEKVTSHFQY